MKTFEITRRGFMLATPLPWLFSPGDAGAVQRHVDRQTGQSLAKWLHRERGSLPGLIQCLAEMERRGVQHEQPATWYRLNYVGAVPWRPGVALLHAFGRPSEALSSFDDTATWLDENHVVTIATGWSDDRRAWTRFVLADRETLAPVITNSIAPVSPCPTNKEPKL
ncbi:MAG: hypothetical protein H6822_33925 [Planctomycetaceae bacterium]|nr:hypothetical protein [Planctomycetales bacterium]MCB9927187.1 hypothetical protein [Planctomycetaceae bacterium]